MKVIFTAAMNSAIGSGKVARSWHIALFRNGSWPSGNGMSAFRFSFRSFR